MDLSPDARFGEQLRCLLNIHSGKLPLRQLNEFFVKEFGVPVGTNVPELKVRCGSVASHVVSCTRSNCLVWAPSAHPYPPRRGASLTAAVSVSANSLVDSAPPQQNTDVVPSEAAALDSTSVHSPVHDPTSVHNPVHDPTSVHNPVHDPTSVHNPVHDPTSVHNPVHDLAHVQDLNVKSTHSEDKQFDTSELEHVLENLRLIKDSSTGELDVDKLDPFLDYFVEFTTKVVNNYKLQKPLARPRSGSKLACQFPRQ